MWLTSFSLKQSTFVIYQGVCEFMKIATINIPDDYLNCIEILVNLGYYPSRSECVREALKQFLGRESTLNENLKVENFQKLKSTQMNSLIH